MAHTSRWKSNKFILKTTGCNNQHIAIRKEFLSLIFSFLHKNHKGIVVQHKAKDCDKSKTFKNK